MKSLISMLVITFFVAAHTNAAEMDHSQMHGNEHHESMMPSDKSAMDNKNPGMDHDMHPSMDHQGMDHKGTDQKMMHENGDQHAGHSMTSKTTPANTSVSLKPLTKVPDSGKAREAGFDGTYTMEDTSVDHSIARRCALASRGLVMLDKAGWKQCGSVPEGLPKDVAKTSATNTHQGMQH